MEERRLLVAVALSLLILTGYQLLFGPRSEPPATEPSPEMASPAVAMPTAGPVPSGPAGSPPAESQPAEAETGTAEVVPSVTAELERRVEVLAPDYTIAFSNRGARLLSWTLTNYRNERGRPEEMVPSVMPGLHPLDFDTGDGAIDDQLHGALFVPSTETLRVDGTSPKTLSFRYADRDIEAEKAFTFEDTGLVVVSMWVKAAGQPIPCRLVWGPGLGNPSKERRKVRGFKEPEGVALVEGDVERLAPGKLESTGQKLPAVRWVGLESVYFAALMVPRGGLAAAEVRPVNLPGTVDAEATVAAEAAVDIAAGSPVLLFVGAKDHDALAKLGYGLEKVVPIGNWIGPIVVPLMRLLRWVHGLVGNWGWAIVILTVMINMVMAPLRHYSIANGMKMAKMQPEMKVIQERYRKVPMMDPRRQKMQEEMGALYAKHGMSMGTQMLVGCLPLLLTMPFLFAFYRVLMISVELRGAPFLWIPDLSQKDPLFITPVLMGVSMYTMQKMTPSTMDPSQQRIMMLMPVMLAGMFLWAPAGLNLYWLTANLWSLFQQVVEMRVLKPKEVAPPPKKGRKKR